MILRRSLVQGLLSAAALKAIPGNTTATQWRAPAEESPHAATWMAWPHNLSIYEDADYFANVQEHLSRLALAISRFEPVFMAAWPEDGPRIRELCGTAVTPVAIPTNDMWMRDTGPVFVVSHAGDLAAVNFNFNGWGQKQEPRQEDARVAASVAAQLGIPSVETMLVGEGGGLEFDGDGTLLLTDSCWLNDNRNPGVSRKEMATELKRLLGVEKVIWLPGVKGQDITDGHIDGSIRFVRPGVILTSGYPGDRSDWGDALRESLIILARETDARARPFEVMHIPSAMEPQNTSEELFTSYANYYVANGAVFTPLFGDAAADRLATSQLTKLFPGREIVGLEVDRIYECGGGIHCVTQQQPRANQVASRLFMGLHLSAQDGA